jgi:hypothetical protein
MRKFALFLLAVAFGLAVIGGYKLIVMAIFALGVLASVTGHGIIATFLFTTAISSLLLHYRMKGLRL